MTTSTYRVDGMTCAHCAQSVSSEVRDLAGVSDAVVDLDAKTVTVTSAEPVAADRVAAAVTEAGYVLVGRA